MVGQLRELLDTYLAESMKLHEAMVKAKHHNVALSQYHELEITPTGLASDQRSGIKKNPPWFTKGWNVTEHVAAMEKTKLLAHYWKEEAALLEGKCLKAVTAVSMPSRRLRGSMS